MQKTRMSKLVRGPGLAGLAILGLGALGPTIASAAVLESDVAADSELELLERAESGAYQRYSIKLTTVEGVSTLSADKDGSKTQVQVPLDDTLALWRDLLKEDLETLADASPEQAVPDQSRFTMKFRVKDTRGGFSAYGVDSLTDGRYRKVVRAILKLADTQVARARAK
jgi:hypothetical protein